MSKIKVHYILLFVILILAVLLFFKLHTIDDWSIIAVMNEFSKPVIESVPWSNYALVGLVVVLLLLSILSYRQYKKKQPYKSKNSFWDEEADDPEAKETGAEEGGKEESEEVPRKEETEKVKINEVPAYQEADQETDEKIDNESEDEIPQKNSGFKQEEIKELKDFIYQARLNGKRDKEIRRAMRKVGWKGKMVDQLFKYHKP